MPRIHLLVIAAVIAIVSTPAGAWARGNMPPTSGEPWDAPDDSDRPTARVTPAKSERSETSTAQADAATAKKAAAEAQAKERLNKTAWGLTLYPMGGSEDPKKKQLTDTVQFVEQQVSSKRLTAQGFPASHFSISVADDGTITWETMQTSDKHGIAFWRGELQSDNIMRGVYSHRPPGEGAAPNDYSFVGRPATLEVPPPAVATPSAVAPGATPTVAAQPATPADPATITATPATPAAPASPPPADQNPDAGKKRRGLKLW